MLGCTVNFLSAEHSAFSQLSAGDLIPVIAITGVIFLLKTGVFSAIFMGIRKLLKKLGKK